MKRIIGFCIALIMLGSCRSTYVTHSWKDASASPARFKKLVVIAIVGDQEIEARKMMEQHMVGDLKELGYQAVCSCEEYSPEFFKGMNEKEAIAKLRENNVDGIVTIVLLSKNKEKVFVQPRSTEVPLFWNYYHEVYDRVYSKGYYTEKTKYFWESNLYDLNADQLLCSVESQSFDPSSTQQLAHEYGRLIVDKMKKAHALVKQDGRILKPM